MSRARRLEIPAETFFAGLWFRYDAIAWFLAGAVLVAGLWELDRNPSAIVVQSGAIANNTTSGAIEVILGHHPMRIRLQGDLIGHRGLQTLSEAESSEPPADGSTAAKWPPPRTPEIRNLTVTQEHASPDPLPYRISLEGGPSIQFRRFALP